MNKIRVLPDNLSNQIAAGEVVERPSSVIKELVENSIDAGATRILIDVELGGRRLMRITDNGEGMTRDDAILAFERHATSKIKTLEDLGKIITLGFRGEALASIASVAKIELLTKREEDSVGTRVIIQGGKLLDVKDAARPTGTTLSVRDLFFNTPARRKFMRSEATENYHLTNIVTHYALAHPEISFALTNNGREVLRVTPAKDLRERTYQIFGGALIDSLLHVNGGREYIAKIKGYVSAPRERRTTRDAQYFFINGRFVRDKLLTKALTEGFRAVLPHGVYPVAFLFLDVPHEEVDANVHPAKTEVRFRRPEAVKEVIAEAVRQALMSAGIIREERAPETVENRIENPATIQESEAPAFQQQPIEFVTDDIKVEVSFAESTTEAPIEDFPPLALVDKRKAAIIEATEPGELNSEQPLEVSSDEFEIAAEQKASESGLADIFSGSNVSNFVPSLNNPPVETVPSYVQGKNVYQVLPPLDSAARIPKAIEIENLSSSKINPIGQLHQSYIIATDDEGLLLIDQHVAHERILFDKFRRKETERKIESQNLLLPETFDLTPAQAHSFDIVEDELENLGFSLMRLSGRTIAVKSVPVDLPVKEVRNLLAEVLDTVDREKRGNAIETIRDNIAASLACKAAVKVNMPLTREKMQWLIDRLLFTTSPTTCPHGRPVILRLTMRDIERGFHRI